MKNRLNVLALSALACSFGALALTSCGGGGSDSKCTVTFVTNGLRNVNNKEEFEFINIEPKKVKKGGHVEEPTFKEGVKAGKTYWTSGPSQTTIHYIVGWSTKNESTKVSEREKFDFKNTPITSDIDLYPIVYDGGEGTYKNATIHRISFDLSDPKSGKKGEWIDKPEAPFLFAPDNYYIDQSGEGVTASDLFNYFSENHDKYFNLPEGVKPIEPKSFWVYPDGKYWEGNKIINEDITFTATYQDL